MSSQILMVVTTQVLVPMVWGGIAQWLSGHPEQSRRLVQTAAVLADELGHRYTQVMIGGAGLLSGRCTTEP